MLLAAPELIAESYGFDYERIKDLPNFKAQLAKVEAELLVEGTTTRAIAEVGLNKAVEKIAERIISERISNDDLNKFANTLHKITNRDGGKISGADAAAQFTLEINMGGETMTISATKTVKLSHDNTDDEYGTDGTVIDGELSHDTAGEVPLLDLDEENEAIPQDILDSIGDTGFSIEIE